MLRGVDGYFVVGGEPAEPAAEGTPVGIDGVDADAFGAEKGGIDEDEAEAGMERGVGLWDGGLVRGLRGRWR